MNDYLKSNARYRARLNIELGILMIERVIVATGPACCILFLIGSTITYIKML